MNQLIKFVSICLIAGVFGQGGSCGTVHTNSANAGPKMQSNTSNDRLATGVWGGQHVQAEVTETGVQLEFDCAHGAIAQAVTLDSNAKFDVAGKFAPEHSGPVLRDEESNDRSVRYKGQVNQQEMTLTISDAGTKEVIGTFTLRHGSEGRIMKCR